MQLITWAFVLNKLYSKFNSADSAVAVIWYLQVAETVTHISTNIVKAQIIIRTLNFELVHCCLGFKLKIHTNI